MEPATLITEWLGRLLGGRAYKNVREAAVCLERAQTLHAENASEALNEARRGLHLLGDPRIRRRGAAEGTILVGLTTIAEELGPQLGQPGAGRQDLLDTLAILGRLDDAMNRFPDLTVREPASSKELRLKWIPYLEARLGDEGKTRLS